MRITRSRYLRGAAASLTRVSHLYPNRRGHRSHTIAPLPSTGTQYIELPTTTTSFTTAPRLWRRTLLWATPTGASLEIHGIYNRARCACRQASTALPVTTPRAKYLHETSPTYQAKSGFSMATTLLCTQNGGATDRVSTSLTVSPTTGSAFPYALPARWNSWMHFGTSPTSRRWSQDAKYAHCTPTTLHHSCLIDLPTTWLTRE